MNKPNIAATIKAAKIMLSKHSPEILTGMGIAGMITTTVLAVRATPTAIRLLEDATYEKEEKLTVLEHVKVCWKPYIPAAVTGTVSIACLIGASSVSVSRNAALATAYKLSETALNDYREKVVETIGEKKEQTVRDKVAKEQIDKHPVSKSEIVVTGKGNTRCFDPLSSRYFLSNIDQVRKAENNLNRRMLHDITGYASINDYYDELGLSHTDIGDTLGWSASNMIELDISAHVAEDGEPALVIGHYNRPTYDYMMY